MRRTAWAAIACFTVAVVLSLIGQATPAEPLFLVAGLLLLTALGLAVALLPVWNRLGLRLPAMPGLFPPVGPGQQWDPETGKPVPRTDKPPKAAKPTRDRGSGTRATPSAKATKGERAARIVRAAPARGKKGGKP